MENKALDRRLCRLTKLLQTECQNYRDQLAVGKSPMEPRQQQVRHRIHEWIDRILNQYEQFVSEKMKAETLIILMDACEIYRDEVQLQVILTLAEKLLPNLWDSPLKCKLFIYCYFYIEEPECASEAKRILDSWDKCNYNAEMLEAEACYLNLVESL